MISRRVGLVLVLMLAATAVSTGFAVGQHQFGNRQFYGGWQRHQKHGYHFRPYYFKPTPNFNGFKHHYVIHHPSRPNHHFFYNPYKKQYWGRCPVSREGGVGKYSLLPVAARKGSLKEIKESDFPELGDVPPIPESEDGEPMDLPPDDLPNESDLTPGKE